MNKVEMATEVTENEVKLHETWVSGEIGIRTKAGSEMADGYLDNHLNVGVHLHRENKISFDISRTLWVHLAGVWNDNQFISEDLLSTTVTLAELKLVHETLGKFISAMDLGLISEM